ncbi:hypothetical protein HanIR_Chr09g0430931 [Helianthus annuus]|nr:hypothetical protein HanIR_Chr09g0430931 [Helianthus annuus]
MLINNQSLLLIIVLSLFALCIDGNNTEDDKTLDLASRNLDFHNISQSTSISHTDHDSSKFAICFPRIPCGQFKICYCCLQPHIYCVPGFQWCQTLCNRDQRNV